MPVVPYQSASPTIAPEVFIAPDAWIIGDVTIGAHASLFFHAVARGDIQPITIGAGTNIQEHVVIHSSHGMAPVVIGENVTVGHRAIIHGCSIGNRTLIGMGATILDNVVIGDECIIGAHALITKGTVIPSRSLVIGSPASIKRPITDDEAAELLASASHYRKMGAEYRKAFPEQY